MAGVGGRSGVEFLDPVDVAVHPALQKLAGAFVGDVELVVDQAFGILQEYLRRGEGVGAFGGQDVAKVLLHHGGAGGAGRCADDAHGLAGPRVLAPRARAPVDAVLDGGRDRAVVFGRDKEDALRIGDLLLELGGGRGQVVLVVLVVERDVAQAHILELEVGRNQLFQRTRQAQIDRGGTKASDKDCNLVCAHERVLQRGKKEQPV